jgi:predicted AAA+ superfamily ATPase
MVACSHTKRKLGYVKRTLWISAVEAALEERNVVWLSGVRRSGKTTLVQSLDGVRYHACELARVRRSLEDPELFSRVEASDGAHRASSSDFVR